MENGAQGRAFVETFVFNPLLEKQG